MKLIKIISTIIVGSGLCVAVASALANPLNISNNSKYELSFSIHNICSKEFGVMSSRSVKTISEQNFKKACKANPNDCEVQVLAGPSCSGKRLATIVFDLRYGAQGLYPDGLSLKSSGFNLFLEGPWAK